MFKINKKNSDLKLLKTNQCNLYMALCLIIYLFIFVGIMIYLLKNLYFIKKISKIAVKLVKVRI